MARSRNFKEEIGMFICIPPIKLSKNRFFWLTFCISLVLNNHDKMDIVGDLGVDLSNVFNLMNLV